MISETRRLGEFAQVSKRQAKNSQPPTLPLKAKSNHCPSVRTHWIPAQNTHVIGVWRDSSPEVCRTANHGSSRPTWISAAHDGSWIKFTANYSLAMAANGWEVQPAAAMLDVSMVISASTDCTVEVAATCRDTRMRCSMLCITTSRMKGKKPNNFGLWSVLPSLLIVSSVFFAVFYFVRRICSGTPHCMPLASYVHCTGTQRQSRMTSKRQRRSRPTAVFQEAKVHLTVDRLVRKTPRSCYPCNSRHQWAHVVSSRHGVAKLSLERKGMFRMLADESAARGYNAIPFPPVPLVFRWRFGGYFCSSFLLRREISSNLAAPSCKSCWARGSWIL